ncbi:hypothetical protein NE865_14499 [Phthorimaea operculella]|nr:hypothetical protein NE865_14499 [Phthorimaea operculella]
MGDQHDNSNMSVEESVVNVTINSSHLDKGSTTPPCFVNNAPRTRASDPDDIEDEHQKKQKKEFLHFESRMMSLLDKWCERQNVKFSKVADDLEAMQKSVAFLTNGFDELKKSTESTNQRVNQLEIKVNSIDSQSAKIETLGAKIEAMEQQARQNNIEISNVPDRRNENLVELIEQLGSAIKYTITKSDIATIHRVPHASATSSHPKNIIVKFHSRITRDNVLAALRLAKGTTTAQLNISGEPRKVYLNEHLTLSNKKLFREARAAANKHKYRYVWIKHGTILVRENDTASVIAIRSPSDLAKINTKTA